MHLSFKKITNLFTELHFDIDSFFVKKHFLLTHSPFVYMTLQFWRSDFQMEVAGYF